MSEVTITINGRHYDIACDAGQEGRIIDLAGYINEKIGSISGSGAAYNDSHLQILTLLVLTDELFELHEKSSGSVKTKTSDADMKKLEGMIRDEVKAEYAERLNAMQTQLANSNQQVKDAQKASETQSGNDDAMKVLQHLTDRVNGLVAKVDSI